MKTDVAISILEGNLQAIDQGIAIVNVLSDEQYCFVASPYVKSTIGQHFRHIIDMFKAVTTADTNIDYDFRRRGADIEGQRHAAINALLDVRVWMLDARQIVADKPDSFTGAITIQSEVTLTETKSVCVASTRLRELMFTSSHAIHHYALISVIAQIQGVNFPEGLGVAPATATFLRKSLSDNDSQIECAQ